MTHVLESAFFLFPLAILGIYFALRQYDRYSRLRRDVQVRIKYFNYTHFAFNDDLFSDYQQKAALEPQDFVDIDRDINFKTAMLHKKGAAYEDFLKILNSLADMKSCLRSVIVCLVLLAWSVVFLVIP
jgi:hypothetical protein